MSATPPPLPVMPVDPNSSSRRSKVWLLVAAYLLLILAGLSTAGWFYYRAHRLPARESLTLGEKHRMVSSAYSSKAVATDQQFREISASLDRFNNVIVTKNSASFSNVFDSDRLIQELERIGALGAIPENQKEGFKSGLREGLGRGLMGQFGNVSWTRHRLKKVIPSDDGREAVVYDVEYHGSGADQYSAKIRWWLRRKGSQWNVWDMESLETGLRMSTLVGSLVASSGPGGAGNPQILSTAMPLLQKMIAGLQRKDFKTAEDAIKSLDTMTLPPELAAIREYARAALRTAQMRFPEAIQACDAADATGQDMPALHELRTIACNKMGEYQKALDSAQKWEDSLGSELELYHQRGLALAGLNSKDEAAKAFEKALDEDPNATGSFTELAGVLPDTDKSELARRFERCQKPSELFRGTIPTLQNRHDLVGMRTVLDAYRKHPEAADDHWVAYYDAETLILQKRYPEAEKELQTLLPFASQKNCECFASEYVYTAELAGDALKAYSTAPDPRKTFGILAARLLDKQDYGPLGKLIATHTRLVPDDSRGYYYQAELKRMQKDPEAADQSFAKAMSLAQDQPDESSQNLIRASWVAARYERGKGLSAYKDIKPADKVFKQLARRYFNDRNARDLAQLVAARSADAPEDPDAFLWDAGAKYLAGDYAAAVEALTTNRKTILSQQFNQYQWTDFYIRSQIRLKHFDEARNELGDQSEARKDWWHTALVECAAGNVPEAVKALDKLLEFDGDYDVSSFYEDPDLGPALSAPAFADWRAKHPVPTTGPATRPAGRD